MPDPIEGAALPQESWNPPGAELDFDSLFGGAGDGSSDIEQAEAAAPPVESTSTEPEPQAAPEATEPQAPTQTTLTQDASGFFIKSGDIVYKSSEEAIKGIAEKNEQIANMRKMLAAVTGQDPLKKGSQSQAEVSYMQDANRYAQDKQRAAEYGERTKDWRPYRDVEAKLQLELIQQTVGQYAPVVQKASRQEALDVTTREIPEFKTFYGTEAYTQALDSRPKLKAAIEYAEQNPGAQSDLPELYKSVHDTYQARRLPELLKQTPQASNPTTPRMPMGKATLTAPKVINADRPGAGQNSVQPGLNTSAGRKALIADMESRGVLDRSL